MVRFFLKSDVTSQMTQKMKNTTRYTKQKMKLRLMTIILLCVIGVPVSAQQIDIPDATPVTQNFNAIGSSNTATLPNGFRLNASANYTGGIGNTVLAAGTSGAGILNGSSASNYYNLANGVTATSTDRAVGFLTSGSGATARYMIAAIKNTGTNVISDLVVAFDYEKYRSGSRAFDMTFFHGPTATNVNIAATAGDQSYAADANNTVIFDPPTGISKSVTLTGLSILPNELYYLCWKYAGNGGASNAQAIGIDNLSLTATFSPICSDPTVQASTVIVTNPALTTADISWTNATGTYGTIVVIRPTASANVLPVSGTNYVANPDYPTAAQTGTNNKVVYKGTGTTVSVTGLTQGTQYTATIYSYNEPGRCYNTTAAESINFFTLTPEPTFTPSSFSCVTASGSQINLVFQAFGANAKGYVITYREGAAPTGLPVDGVQYSPGATIGDATVLTEITSSTATTFNATGLNGGSVYHFALFPFNGTVGNGITYNYKTTSPRTTNCSTTTAPEINIKGVIGANPSILNGDFTPRTLDNTSFGSVAVGGNIVKVFRIENLGNAPLTVSSIVFNGGNASEFVVSGVSFPLNISGAAYVDFTITFTPTNGGLRSTTVQINNNDSDESLYQYAIEGTGNAAEIDVLGGGISIPTGSVTVNTVNQTQFGDVNYAAGSVAHTFTISNLGTIALNISSATITGSGDFTITTAPASSIAAGAATTLVITFDPSTAGVKNATVTLVNTDPNENPYTFAIQGTGTNYIFCSLGTPQLIAQQHFETMPPVPPLGYTVSQETGMSVPLVQGGNLLGDNRTATTPAFITARSFQVKGYSTSSSDPELSATIEFDTKDVSAYQDVYLNFKLGAYSSTVGSAVGLDTDDQVQVFISTNGGTSWSHEMTVSGYSNAIWDINTGTKSATIDADGDNIPTKFSPPTTLNTVDEGPRDITINKIPSSSQLKIKIVFLVNRTDEVWVVDNVQLHGKLPAETVWTGSAWSAGAPDNTKKAIFRGSYNAGINVEACACEIESAATVTIANGKYLEVQNTINNAGSIVIANNGSLVQVNDYAVNNGLATVHRNTSPYDAFDYTYWSSPVAPQPTLYNIGTFFPGMRVDHSYSFNTPNYADANFDGYDDGPPSQWVTEGPSATMEAGKGYIVRGTSVGPFPATSTANFQGVLNNGIVGVTVHKSNSPAISNENYNLLGNPYASAISADQFILDNTNTSGGLYFWTHVGNIAASVTFPGLYEYSADDFAVYTLMGGTGTDNVDPIPGHNGNSNLPLGFIASGQGFFTNFTGPGLTGTVTFNNNLRRKTYDNTQFFKLGTPEKDRIWLNLTNPDHVFSQTLIGYTDQATLGEDRGYDAVVRPSPNYVRLYSIANDVKYTIQARPEFDLNDVVRLGYFSSMRGIFEIQIDNKEGKIDSLENIYLEDKELNIVHDLKQGSYYFNTEVGAFNDRFVLKYKNALLNNDSFDNDPGNVMVLTKNKQIAIKSVVEPMRSITVFDVLGRTIFNSNGLNQKEFTISEIAQTQQALIVKIVLENGKTTTKKIVF